MYKVKKYELVVWGWFTVSMMTSETVGKRRDCHFLFKKIPTRYWYHYWLYYSDRFHISITTKHTLYFSP